MDMQDIAVSGAFYSIPTNLSRQSIDALLLESNSWDRELQPAATLSGRDLNRRKSKVSWLPVDHWVAGMMAHLVREANYAFFKADLTTWADRIQYTIYDGGEHDYYNWHIDTTHSAHRPDEIRKISVSLLLSGPEDYEGGELQLHRLNNTDLIKPPLGTAIIFSSQTPHRVRPVKKGVRKSLVGWFGGPPWK